MGELECPVAGGLSSQSALAADGGNPVSSREIHAAGLRNYFFDIVHGVQATRNVHTGSRPCFFQEIGHWKHVGVTESISTFDRLCFIS